MVTTDRDGRKRVDGVERGLGQKCRRHHWYRRETFPRITIFLPQFSLFNAPCCLIVNVSKRFHGDFPRPVVKTDVYTIAKQFFVFFPSRRTNSSRLPPKTACCLHTMSVKHRTVRAHTNHGAAKVFNRTPVEYKSCGLLAAFLKYSPISRDGRSA